MNGRQAISLLSFAPSASVMLASFATIFAIFDTGDLPARRKYASCMRTTGCASFTGQKDQVHSYPAIVRTFVWRHVCCVPVAAAAWLQVVLRERLPVLTVYTLPPHVTGPMQDPAISKIASCAAQSDVATDVQVCKDNDKNCLCQLHAPYTSVSKHPAC